jgi:hypothetical protein
MIKMKIKVAKWGTPKNKIKIKNFKHYSKGYQSK